MRNIDKETAERLGDVLFRYIRARHRFQERVQPPLPANELAALIRLGKQEFDEIHIEHDANPPIVLDRKAPGVFEAIINKRYSAIPVWDSALVAAWRMYVLRDGPMPRQPAPRRPHAGADPLPRRKRTR